MLAGLPDLIPPSLGRIKLACVPLALDHELIQHNVAELPFPVLVEDSFAINAKLIFELVDDVALELMSFPSS